MTDNLVGPRSHEVWSGLPPREQAAAWEKQVPGSARIMLEEVRRLNRHKRRIAVAQIGVQVLLIVCAFSSVILFVWLATYFVNHHAPTQGAIVVGAGLVSLVGAFLGRGAISKRTSPDSSMPVTNGVTNESGQ